MAHMRCGALLAAAFAVTAGAVVAVVPAVGVPTPRTTASANLREAIAKTANASSGSNQDKVFFRNPAVVAWEAMNERARARSAATAAAVVAADDTTDASEVQDATAKGADVANDTDVAADEAMDGASADKPDAVSGADDVKVDETSDDSADEAKHADDDSDDSTDEAEDTDDDSDDSSDEAEDANDAVEAVEAAADAVDTKAVDEADDVDSANSTTSQVQGWTVPTRKDRKPYASEAVMAADAAAEAAFNASAGEDDASDDADVAADDADKVDDAHHEAPLRPSFTMPTPADPFAHATDAVMAADAPADEDNAAKESDGTSSGDTGAAHDADDTGAADANAAAAAEADDVDKANPAAPKISGWTVPTRKDRKPYASEAVMAADAAAAGWAKDTAPPMADVPVTTDGPVETAAEDIEWPEVTNAPTDNATPPASWFDQPTAAQPAVEEPSPTHTPPVEPVKAPIGGAVVTPPPPKGWNKRKPLTKAPRAKPRRFLSHGPPAATPRCKPVCVHMWVSSVLPCKALVDQLRTPRSVPTAVTASEELAATSRDVAMATPAPAPYFCRQVVCYSPCGVRAHK